MRQSSFIQHFHTNTKRSIKTKAPYSVEEPDLKQSLIYQLSKFDDEIYRSEKKWLESAPKMYVPLRKTEEKEGFCERTSIALSRGGYREDFYWIADKSSSTRVDKKLIRSCQSSRKIEAIASKEYLEMQIRQAFSKLNQIKEVCQRRKSEKKQIISRGNRSSQNQS